MPSAEEVKRTTKMMARKTKQGIEKAKLLAAEAGVVMKRAKYALKTSKKAQAAAVAGAAVAAVAIGAAVARRARKT